MRRRVMRLGLILGTALAVVAPIGRAAAVHAAPAGGNDAHRYVSVMTRNLDEGTDFGYIQQAAAGTLPFSTAVLLTYAEVVQSDVCGRAAREADEIAAAQPDIVSVQEAAVWTGPLPVSCPGAATPMTLDAEAALLSRLAADGAHYTVVRALDEFSSAPLGLVAPGLSFLDRDVMLARVEPPGQLAIANVQAQHYTTLVPILGLPILRGWISADTTLRGRTVRVIATHLESFYEPVQEAQAMELAGSPANTSLPVIVAGDLNTGPGSTQQASYDWLTTTRRLHRHLGGDEPGRERVHRCVLHRGPAHADRGPDDAHRPRADARQPRPRGRRAHRLGAAAVRPCRRRRHRTDPVMTAPAR